MNAPAPEQAPADADNWQELQRLFHLFDRTGGAQSTQDLIAACPDLKLRERVLALLHAAGAADDAPSDARPHYEEVGPYRLIRRLGAGGIGTVYLAERVVDGTPLRSALKVLAPHAVDPSFVERFRREQRHLAALDHPNITRLLDAGWTAAGQPYLVMEYVDGEHLDAYCDSRRLGIDARLGLFLQICAAVGSAHRNLIVHLDLKPSNVLVSTTGVVKLLDFGTSKLVRVDGKPTSTLMATPAYASPEQLMNEPVTTASDIYGLGAILFELLAGRAPFGNVSAVVRIEGAARELEPQDVSTAASAQAATNRGLSGARLRQTLRGDLAAIAGVCLRARPRDRYASADALSDDIKRHLNCEPVRARRQTFGYRTGKFLRRRRAPLAVAVLVALTIAASIAFAWSQQHRALREAQRAVRMQSFLFSLFKMANPKYTGKPTATVPEFLRAGMAELPQYIREPSDLRKAELALAESMYQSGSLDDARAALAGIIAHASAPDAVADKAEAEAVAGAVEFQRGDIAAGRALAADALKLSANHAVPPRVRVLSEIYYAFNEDNNGYQTTANLRLLRAAVAESQNNHLAPRDAARALYYLGSDLYLRGASLEAKPIFEKLLPLYRGDPLALCDRSEIYGWLAWIDNTTGSIGASLPLFRRAYDGYVRCSGADSRGALDQLPYWADALIRSGRAADAVRMLEAALPTWRRVIGGGSDQAEMLYYLARGYIATHRYVEAEGLANELLHRLEGRLAPDDRTIGLAQLALGEALAGEHRYADAAPHAEAAVRLLVNNAVSNYARELGAEAQRLSAHVDAAQQAARQ